MKSCYHWCEASRFLASNRNAGWSERSAAEAFQCNCLNSAALVPACVRLSFLLWNRDGLVCDQRGDSHADGVKPRLILVD